jgi:hypothetical protein
MWWLVLAACAPGPGEEGYEACDPVVIDRDCAVWLCHHVWRDRELEWWVEYDGAQSSVAIECDEYDCTQAIDDAALQACEVRPAAESGA